MKWKTPAALAMTALLLGGLLSALAVPADSADPLVSRTYLSNTYLPELQAALLLRAQTDTEGTYTAAQTRLDQLAAQYAAQAGGPPTTAAPELQSAPVLTPLSLVREDALRLPAGSSLLLLSGTAELELTAGAAIDVTAGSVTASGSKLTAGHRYLFAEDAAASVTVRSDAASLAVQGFYSLSASNETQTPFTDLCSTDWYYSYARYAYEHGLFQGTSADCFTPTGSMTRAMLATVLSRMAGVENGGPDAGFTDVPPDAWYASAVNWAANAAVVNGMGSGLFCPDINITREQMAAMLYRYAGSYLGRDVSARGDLSAFPDCGSVSAWAEDAVAWAVGAGLLTGYGDGTLGPGGTATRAEVAAMLQRFTALIA